MKCRPSGRVETLSAPQSIKKLSFGWKISEGDKANEGEEKEKRRVMKTRRIAIRDDELKGDRKGCMKAIIVFSIFPIPPGVEDEDEDFFQFRMNNSNNKEA